MPVQTHTAATTMPRSNYKDAMEFLVDAMNNQRMPITMRIGAATALLPYQHARIGEKGKKATQKERAHERTGGGGYRPMQPPRLSVVKND